MFVNSPVVIYNICECLFQFNCRCRQLNFNLNSMENFVTSLLFILKGHADSDGHCSA